MPCRDLPIIEPGHGSLRLNRSPDSLRAVPHGLIVHSRRQSWLQLDGASSIEVRMALISVGEVQGASRLTQFSHTKSASTILRDQRERTPVTQTFDIFLSHSYADAKLVLDLKDFLEGFDTSVYVDWIDDRQLDRSNVNARTAAQLRRRMNKCKALLFATTQNSSTSIWMPWELGYFDGKKGRVAVIPLTARKEYGNSFKGQEYLGLYPYVVRDHSDRGEDLLWVHTDPTTYTTLTAWLAGHDPRPN